MFEWLAEYSKILVSGPQRSGTRLTSYAVSVDTGRTFYQEEKVGIANLEKLRRLVETEDNFVIQCPALCRYVHLFSARDIAVVLMCRAIKDIVASENRIGWGGHRRGELERYGLSHGVISEVKYLFWFSFQKHRIMNAFEVEYESLSEHPLWVSKELRKKFNKKQIAL